MAAGALPLAACGGGGNRVASIPTPTTTPPTPPPPPPALPPVKIFPNPVAGDFTSVGASVPASGTVPFYYDDKDARFGTISRKFGPADLSILSERILRSATSRAALRPVGASKSRTQSRPEQHGFELDANKGWVVTNGSVQSGYRYSELATWASSNRFGYVAFGSATPAGSVPIAGTATFSGISKGSADIMLFDQLAGSYFAVDVFGDVKLDFDFGAGTLAGSMSLSVGDGMQPLLIGTFAFRNTVFSAGSTTYSGNFDTTATGQNSFLGKLTGLNAEETIGAWAVPSFSAEAGHTSRLTDKHIKPSVPGSPSAGIRCDSPRGLDRRGGRDSDSCNRAPATPAYRPPGHDRRRASGGERRSEDGGSGLRGAPDDPNRDVRAEALFRHGLLLVEAGQLQKGAMLLRKVVDARPDAVARASNWRGRWT